MKGLTTAPAVSVSCMLKVSCPRGHVSFVLLVSNKNCDFWPDSISEHAQGMVSYFLANHICQICWEVCESRTSSVHVSAHAQKTGTSARGPNSWCQPKGVQPLGTKMHVECS